MREIGFGFVVAVEAEDFAAVADEVEAVEAAEVVESVENLALQRLLRLQTPSSLALPRDFHSERLPTAPLGLYLIV